MAYSRNPTSKATVTEHNWFAGRKVETSEPMNRVKIMDNVRDAATHLGMALQSNPENLDLLIVKHLLREIDPDPKIFDWYFGYR